MKYGETLQQRSIPLWASYNVEYNDIKHLIKARTTQGQGQARAIPGSNGEAKAFAAFEDELYNELKEQHERIELFVQSKSGEIARRLAHLDKQIAHLGIRSFSKGHTKLPMRHLEKFSKAEEATLKAGEDIQSLSRFVGAQRTAFQKLLKKYKKWTSSSELGVRFRAEVLDRPTSFSKRDFEPLLAQWTEVLAAVRAPFSDGANWQQSGLQNSKEEISQSEVSLHKKPPQISTQQPNQGLAGDPNSLSELHCTWEDGSNIDIDTALAVLPLGRGATRAVYWVHPDNIVQVHVLLLQYTRFHITNSAFSPESPSSSRSSPRTSFNNPSGRSASRTDDEIGVIVCDDFQSFSKLRSSETISVTEDCPGTVAEKATASIRFSSSGEVIVVVDTIAGGSKSPNSIDKHFPKKAKLKRKAVRQLFEASSVDRAAKDDANDPERVCEWFTEHREVQPLVQLLSRRTRFIGLGNNQSGGVWATLDKDVYMRKCSSKSFASSKGLSTISEGGKVDAETFPHAILEIRVEGDADSKLIAALDASHLTERVRGFSLETHAVATLCKPNGMPRPFWLPVLNQDIRKIPAAPKMSRRGSSQVIPEGASTQHSSVSAPSTQNGHSSSGFSALRGESSATSVPEAVLSPASDPSKKKRRRSQRKLMLQKRLSQTSQPRQQRQQRYWNEFDDGSEGSENEAYTIDIDPNASYSFPCTTTISKIFASLVSNIKVSEEKVASWLKHQPSSTPDERQPLNNDLPSPSVDDSDMSDYNISTTQHSPSTGRHYSTFLIRQQSPAVRAREMFLFRSCLASFTASIILLLVATILDTTGRRKAEFTVDAGVIIGVAASLVFAIMGVGCMIGRKEHLGWVHRIIVILVFAALVLGSGGLLAALSS